MQIYYTNTCVVWTYTLRALYNIIACDCTANITHNRKNEQMLYCDAVSYVRLLWFNKNHKFEHLKGLSCAKLLEIS